jgi:hypothetical protein
MIGAVQNFTGTQLLTGLLRYRFLPRDSILPSAVSGEIPNQIPHILMSSRRLANSFLFDSDLDLQRVLSSVFIIFNVVPMALGMVAKNYLKKRGGARYIKLAETHRSVFPRSN